MSHTIAFLAGAVLWLGWKVAVLHARVKALTPPESSRGGNHARR